MNLLAHLRDVALVLADLEKNDITAKPSKSFFAMQRLRVIGLIVSKLGIQVNPDRLQAITEFQMPDFLKLENKTAVVRLLGMANQYRNHIFKYREYAKIVDPLCRLTEGEWPTRWDSESVPEECHTALEKLKTALTSPGAARHETPLARRSESRSTKILRS